MARYRLEQCSGELDRRPGVIAARLDQQDLESMARQLAGDRAAGRTLQQQCNPSADRCSRARAIIGSDEAENCRAAPRREGG